MPVTIDDQNGDIIAGGAGSGGTLVLRGGADERRLNLTAGGLIEAGGNGANGELRLFARNTDSSSLTSFDEAIFQLKASLDASILAGGQGFGGRLALRDKNGQTRISFDAASGDARLGGDGSSGDLTLFSQSTTGENAAVIRLNGFDAEIKAGVRSAAGHLRLFRGQETIHLDGASANIIAGGDGVDGDVILRNGEGQARINLITDAARISVGGHGVAGNLELFPAPAKLHIPGRSTIQLEGETANIIAGGEGADGDVTLKSGDRRTRIHLNAGSGRIEVGGQGVSGKLKLFHASEDSTITGRGTIELEGETANIRVGGEETEGDLVLVGPKREKRVTLSGGGKVCIGGNGGDGILAVFDKNDDNSSVDRAAFRFDTRNGELKVKDWLQCIDGVIQVGCNNRHGKLLLRNESGKETISVEGDKGDVILANADCAEDFDLADDEDAVPGAVMTLSADGSLRQSDREYDTTVAGVVSGAGSYRPGIVLDRHVSERPRVPLAMVGKVFCLVDADFGAVQAGTLLTTSPRRGHAMCAVDSARAFGAVLGKALKPLERGQALVPVMVALQ